MKHLLKLLRFLFRFGQSGKLYCVLRDSGSAGIETLAEGIDHAGHLETWTTHLLYQ